MKIKGDVIPLNKETNLSFDQIVNMPDIMFINYCYKKYGLNKGIYNTIDLWLYKKEIHDIVNRRKKIIHFLEFMKNTSRNHNKNKTKLTFGCGGLSEKLTEFLEC
ncbi:hypothetical protein BTR23_10675 [Alkalihalophilus pseudofirmus]|nr:hypothetical protein BTR23_10675 [Alkalihalophilus pseudofirmus]